MKKGSRLFVVNVFCVNVPYVVVVGRAAVDALPIFKLL
jgi:hypothetical protein